MPFRRGEERPSSNGHLVVKQVALRAALAAWYANAHDIAVFLSNANPKNWPLSEMEQMMKDHLDATTDEAIARH
jgi:hypothetical protein